MNIVDGPGFSGARCDVWKVSVVQHLLDLRFTHALTLAWNRKLTLDSAKADLARLHRRVDHELLGGRYHRKPVEVRTLAVFVFEQIKTHIHVHSLWRIQSRQHLIPFARLFPKERGGVWNNIVPSGSYKLAINDDPVNSILYALKDQHPNSDAGEIVWSRDFLRQK
jgi:hypothetical protein